MQSIFKNTNRNLSKYKKSQNNSEIINTKRNLVLNNSRNNNNNQHNLKNIRSLRQVIAENSSLTTKDFNKTEQLPDKKPQKKIKFPNNTQSFFKSPDYLQVVNNP